MSETFRVRMVPEPDLDSERYWTSGVSGSLVLPRCTACGHHLMPPAPICRHCRSTVLEEVALSGLGVVYTFTINYQPWLEDLDVPNVIVVIDLAEEDGLRVLATLVGVEPQDVHIGLPVRLAFAVEGDVAVPYAVRGEQAVA